ncbi:VOC family protein [Occultella glacieicola]|nr:VOC family protein [Occultella glacieicola]
MITSSYPVLMSTDVAASARFFTERFGFETVFEADWYVSLRQGTWELAFVAADHPTIPHGFGTAATGVLLNIEVDQVDDAYARLTAGGDVRVALELRSEDFGQRHFIVVAPGGVLVDVIEPIPFTGEFAADD